MTILIGGVEVECKNHPRAKRLTLSARGGRVLLTKPNRVPKTVAERFARRHHDWIRRHYKPPLQIKHGSRFGDITFSMSSSNAKPIWSGNTLILPKKAPDLEDLVKRALRTQARHRVYQRVDYWADKMSLEPQKLRIAATTSRWGSCSSRGTLSFSIYAAQLPDDIFDYLVVHEMAHLVHPNHGQLFWKTVSEYVPDYKTRRRQLKSYALGLYEMNV